MSGAENEGKKKSGSSKTADAGKNVDADTGGDPDLFTFEGKTLDFDTLQLRTESNTYSSR